MNKKYLILYASIASLLSGSTVALDQIFIKEKNQIFSQPREINNLINTNKNHTFKVVKEVKLQNGKVKHKFRQYYKNIPILGASISATKTKVGYMNLSGSYFDNFENELSDISKNISKAEAINIATKFNKISSVNLIKNKTADLYIYKGKAKKANLVYMVSYFVEKEFSRPYFLIDAKNGNILDTWEGLTTSDAIGPGGNGYTGKYVYGVDYAAMRVTNDCKMDNENVVTYNMDSRETGGSIFQFTCPENTYKLTQGGYSPLNDVHFFGTFVVDMYLEKYGEKPVPFKIRLNAHYGRSLMNSLWDGSAASFGDGYSFFTFPFTTIDVVSHEISHGFTENNSNLLNKKQSGALNEGFSYMAGEAAKYYLNSDKPEIERNDFIYAANVYKYYTGMKFFKDPKADSYSIDHVDSYYDSLDTHLSSGVYRKAFYTLATTENWNTGKAFEVFVLANKIYWHENTSFDEGGCGVAKAAVDFGYSLSDVVAAFSKVGIDAACIDPPDPIPAERLNNGIPIEDISDTIGNEKFWVITVPENRSKLEIKISGGTGDADLYSLKGALPSICKWDCRPFLPDNNEVCVYANPLPGNYYIMLNAAESYAGVKLEGNY